VCIDTRQVSTSASRELQSRLNLATYAAGTLYDALDLFLLLLHDLRLCIIMLENGGCFADYDVCWDVVDDGIGSEVVVGRTEEVLLVDGFEGHGGGGGVVEGMGLKVGSGRRVM